MTRRHATSGKRQESQWPHSGQQERRSSWGGPKTPQLPSGEKESFAVAPDGRILSADDYDPLAGHILVEG